MNFQQLKIIREAVHRNFNLTEVAAALATSQSGVSKHIRDIEDELGFELFVRRGKRFLGLTAAGEQAFAYVEKILQEAENIKLLANDLAKVDEGELILATTHTQARYSLPAAVAAFRKAFPKVHLVLHQGSPTEIANMLIEGRADIGVATEAVTQHSDIVTFPYYSWRHIAIVAHDHPLANERSVTLNDLASQPIITYHEGYTGRPIIDRTFAAAHLVPDIVMAALDADVIKAYTELGLGVGIVASMSFDPQRDVKLRALAHGEIFPECTSHIALRRGRFMRGFDYRFIEFCSASLTQKRVQRGLAGSG